MQNQTQFMGNFGDSRRLYAFLLQFLPPSGKLIDIGCGRGEWLEVAKKSGLHLLGIDSDSISIQKVKSLGLEALQCDYLHFLKDILEAKVAVVTAFHLVEHLSPIKVEEFISMVFDSLKQNGTFIIVTPNFGDYRISSEIFWLDPTHVRPYPLKLLQAMCQENGFNVRYSNNRNLVKMTKREMAMFPLNRLRFGAQYGRSNSILVVTKS